MLCECVSMGLGTVAILTTSTFLIGKNDALGGEATTIAVIGDSISTGAAAHPEMRFDRNFLIELFTGKRTLVSNDNQRQSILAAGFLPAQGGHPPVRLGPSIREYDGPLTTVAHGALHTFMQLYFDMTEFSWGYFVGSNKVDSPSKLLIAAEDGATMESASRQIDRVLDKTAGQIPEHLFIFFTGNDLCGPSMDYVTGAREYGAALEHALRYLLRNGKAAAGGVDIWILDPIGILQLTQVESIQNKQVQAHGQTMSCQKLQHYTGSGQGPSDHELKTVDPMITLLMYQFPHSPAFFCPTVLGGALDSNGRDSQILLANRLRSYREEIGSTIQEMNAKYLTKEQQAFFRLHQIKDTGKITLTGDDIAQDCFHLSLLGQLKLAQTVQKAMH